MKLAIAITIIVLISGAQGYLWALLIPNILYAAIFAFLGGIFIAIVGITIAMTRLGVLD